MIAPLARILLVLCALVAGGIVALWNFGERTWTPPDARQIDPSLYEIPVIDSKRVDVAALGEITARPLFSSTRRPPPPPEPVAAVDAEPDPFVNVKVLGLFGSGVEGGAILLVDGKAKRVRFGEKVGPWVLSGVSGMSARFARANGRQTTLEMRYLPQPQAASGGGDSAPVDALAAPAPQTGAPDQAAPADPAMSPAARAAQARAEARARRLQPKNSNQ